MFPLLFWGLPTSETDDLLFADNEPWPPNRYNVEDALEQRRARDAGADTDLDPLADHTQPIELTATDADRAQILRRYRLYSRQPDEIIVFQALQRMNPRAGDFDPRLYQYGGGYLYLVAASFVAADLVGFANVTSDANVYLEQPESFARFYVVARVLSLVFGGLALLAVRQLARHAAGRTAGWLAFLLVACSPVFITAVVEAKPHLPSAALILWAALSALRYHRTGRLRDALWSGAQAGYAFGLVLTGCLSAILAPVLLAMSRSPSRAKVLRHLAYATLLAAAVYAVTNPYVVYHLAIGGEALRSNLGNSTAMYEDQMSRAAAGTLRVFDLLLESLGPGVLLLGVIGLATLVRTYPRRTLIVTGPGLLMLLMGCLLGASKPAEFARFLILPAMLLCVAAAILLAWAARRRRVPALVAAVVALVLLPTSAYVNAIATDAAGTHESRRAAARALLTRMAQTDSLALIQEPAPYATPPIDFVQRRVILLPDAAPENLNTDDLPTWLVYTADDDQAHAQAWWHAYYKLDRRIPGSDTRLSPITWANKPVYIYRRPN